MAVIVDTSGLLEVRFHTTPARQTGLLVSGATMVIVIALGLLAKRQLA